MKQRKTSRAGFTLVEVMVSMVILILVIGGSIATFGLSMRSVYSANEHIESIHSLRAVYEEIAATVEIENSWTPANNVVSTTNSYGKSVSYSFSNMGNRLRRINLSVSYTNTTGQVVTKSMSGVLGETLH